MSVATVKSTLLGLLTGATDIPVIADGVAFTPKSLTDYPFIRAKMMPRESRMHGLHGITKEAGLYAITVWFSRAAITTATAETATILAAFEPQNINSAGTLPQLEIEMSWVEAEQHDATCFGIPILVRWSNYTA